MRPIVISETTSPVLVTARVSRSFETVVRVRPPEGAEGECLDCARFERLIYDWIAAVYGEFDPET
jgi:hypothetical protein